MKALSGKLNSPALVLLLLAPLLGELVSGHMPPLEFLNPYRFVLLALPYGFGALVVRELKARWGKGWLSFLMLAVGYGLFEEGVVARSFYNPEWFELEALAGYDYWNGINWTFSFNLVHFHVTVSIFSSVALAEIWFARRRDEPWLKGWQLAACFVGLAAWAVALWLLAPFVPDAVRFGAVVLLMIGLVVAAWRWAPALAAPIKRRIPRPFWFGALGALNMTAVFSGTYMVPEMSNRPPMVLMLCLLVLVDLISLAVLLRWSRFGRAWTDRHRFALVAGLLSFFIVFGFLADAEDGFTGKSVTSLLALCAFGWAALRLRPRWRAEDETRRTVETTAK